MHTQNTPISGGLADNAPAATVKRAPTPEEVVKMQAYAKNWVKRHPKKNAAHLTKVMLKKFGVELT